MLGHPIRPVNQALIYRTVGGRRWVRGATLVELMIMASLAVVICTVMARVVTTSWTMGKITLSKATLQTQGRRAMTLFQDDLQGSSFALPSYSTYSASQTTLILQAPSYNSSFQQISGANDTIIYRLVGTSAPYTLNRRVIPASGSARPAVSDIVVVENVSSLRFSYLYDQKTTGTGFPILSLVLVNLAATPGLASSLGLPTPTALINGTAATSGVAFSNTLVGISPTPASGVPLEFLYPVDPGTSVNQANVNAVFVTITASVTDPSLKNAATQVIVLNGGGVLRNH